MHERKRTFGHRALLTALACAGVAVASAPDTAHATVEIAADVEADVPVGIELDAAPAFAVRLGYQLHLPAIVLTPEIGVHHASFDPDPTLLRGIAGARLGIGEIFRVGAYAHVGFARLAFDSPSGDGSETAFSYDVGAFLDFTLLPLLNIGVHTGYGHVDAIDDDAEALNWIPLGVHVALIL
jgi:hypothetical protein